MLLILKAGDVIVQYLGTFLLLEKVLGEQFELHNHVGQSGWDFLLEEKIGVCLIMRFTRVQQLLNRYWSWRVPATLNINITIHMGGTTKGEQ